jgi:hypothetical protein
VSTAATLARRARRNKLKVRETGARIPGGVASAQAFGIAGMLPREFATFIRAAQMEICYYLATEMHAQIVDYTPVLTGALKGNWVGTTDRTMYQFDYAFKGLGADHRPRKPRFIRKTMPVYNITNAAWYGHQIEFEGRSKTKAPDGMVRRGYAEVMARPVTLEVVVQQSSALPDRVNLL